MLSKPQIKYIRTLQLKKFRQKNGVYIAEGIKLVDELLEGNSEIHTIFAVKDWIAERKLVREHRTTEIVEVSEMELKQISSLKTPNQVLAIVAFDVQHSRVPHLPEGLYLALDDIRDPGNMGTIIRTADWFGVNAIFCSPECVDMHNPKVVQATMGSIARVKVYITDLTELLEKQQHLPAYGAVLDGDSVYQMEKPTSCIIVVGNESHGITGSLEKKLNHKVTIPSFGKSESLNVAAAVGILLSEFRRK